MKTIRQYLETLPEPYRSQALANASPTMLDETTEDLASAVKWAFVWFSSPEKYNYWNNFHKTLLP